MTTARRSPAPLRLTTTTREDERAPGSANSWPFPSRPLLARVLGLSNGFGWGPLFWRTLGGEPRAPPIRGHFLPALSLCLFVCTRPAPLSVSIWAQGLEIAPVPAPPVSLLAAPLPLAMSSRMRLAPDLPLLACSFSSIFSTRNCGGTMRREILATRDGRPAEVPTTRADLYSQLRRHNAARNPRDARRSPGRGPDDARRSFAA